MSRNLIFMVAIDHASSKYKNSDYAQYSITAWHKYAEKINCEFCVVNRSQFPDDVRPIWNKELISSYGVGFDKIAVIDSDTLPSPNCPNLFDTFTEDEFCGVNDLCDLNWLFGSIDVYQKFFSDVEMDIFKYVNAGVLFFGKKHLHIFDRVLKTYFDNKEELDNWDKGGGREQTLLNFVLREQAVDVTLLSPAWNLLAIERKNMFTNNWQLWYGLDCKFEAPMYWPHFMRYANIWHFTGFPIEDRTRLMRKTFEFLHGYE